MATVRSVALVSLLLSLTACAGAARAPLLPDESALQPAQAAVDKAEAAGAAQLAPGALREAHRRLELARGVFYQAATGHRQITETEQRRIRRLVEEAAVDARLALALTQLEAVNRKRNEFQSATQESNTQESATQGSATQESTIQRTQENP